MAKSIQDLVIWMRELQQLRDVTDMLSIQIYNDRSYRIYDQNQDILFDSDQDMDTDNGMTHDINDLPYLSTEFMNDAIINMDQTANGDEPDGTA